MYALGSHSWRERGSVIGQVWCEAWLFDATIVIIMLKPCPQGSIHLGCDRGSFNHSWRCTAQKYSTSTHGGVLFGFSSQHHQP